MADDLDGLKGEEQSLLRADRPLTGPEKLMSVQFADQRRRILLVVSVAMFFVPIAGVTYVPSIPVVQAYFDATSFEITMSLVAFCVFIGVMPLFYGPVGDWAGRKVSLMACLTAYGAANICAGSSLGIWYLVFFRGLIAFFNAGFTTFCTGIISDVVPVERRATAIGASLLLAMGGTIFGAPVAGLVNDNLGWRWVFYIIGLSVFPVVLLVGFVVPETRDFSDNKDIQFSPLNALKVIFRWPLIGMVAANAFAFGAMYTVNAEMSTLMSYYFGLSSTQIGVLYMPYGIGMLGGTIFGGKVADLSRKRWGVSGALSIAFLSAVITVVTTVIYGWTAPYSIILSVTFASLAGFGAMASRGVIFTYATELNRTQAGTATSGLVCVQFAVVCAELFVGGIIALPPEEGGIGPGWTFTILSTFVVILLPLMLIVIYQNRPRSVSQDDLVADTIQIEEESTSLAQEAEIQRLLRDQEGTFQ